MDWVVVRNRTGHIEARNMGRIEGALKELSKRVGFRVAQGLSERVVYRELFPSGLTLLDKGHLGELGTSHLVARQELRALVQSLGLPEFAPAQRSEEHTSELQSLMRISYAVFCLKKKKKIPKLTLATTTYTQQT